MASLLSAVVLLAVSACSSGDETATDGGPAADAGPGLERAQEVVDEYSAVPSEILQTVPLESAPEPGETLVWMQCGVPACGIIGGGIEEAAEALDWDVEVISYEDANPSTLVSGMRQALELDPVAVVLSGIDPAQWSSVLPEYEAADVPIIAAAVGPSLEIEFPVVAGVADEQAYALPGQILADWFITDSEGDGKALIVGVPSYPVLKMNADAVAAEIEANCPGCEVTRLDATLDQVGQNGVVPAVVSEIQKDPSIEYVLAANGAFVGGLPAALNAAGITGTKIGSSDGNIVNQENVANGVEHATMGIAFEVMGWVIVDAAARHLQGMEIPAGNGGLPTQLLTRETIGEPRDTLLAPPDYADQFSELWQIG